MTSFCLTLAERDLSSLEGKLRQYGGQVPFIEVRLDFLAAPGIPKLPSVGATQFIATCRPIREGGRFKGEEEVRLDLLVQAAQSGFSWVDLEDDVTASLQLPDSVRRIRSRHIFGEFPADLDRVMPRLKGGRGDLAKLAVSVATTCELVTLLRWMESLPQHLQRVVIGMGRPGQLTRFLGCMLGNAWTYVVEESEVAPGQFSLSEARDLYQLHRFTAGSPLYGVIGNPISHSRSPALHNALFQRYGIEGLYLPMELDALAPWFEFLTESKLRFKGFSVTIPFKLDVRPFAEVQDSPVEAVNTLKKSHGRWLAWNTDFPGFIRPLRRRLGSLGGKRALLLGNGGVAQSVASFLTGEGVDITVVGRDRGRVTEFARQFGCRGCLFSDLPIEADLCVNTTPVGQYPESNRSPIAREALVFDTVYDLIYNPEETLLLRWARERGCRVISGLEMFIEQGAEQFRLWTGVDPDREFIREVLAGKSTGV